MEGLDRRYVGRMAETEVDRGGRTIRVRDTGDPEGRPLIHFHGTPGCRLEVAFADDLAADLGVRLVTFDRPGYGGATPAPFGLVSIAHDAAAVADALGIEQFATLGQSGGGPFSLACAAVLGARVSRAGVASGAGPFQLVPGAVDSLDAGDQAALALLPGDPEGAARAFGSGFEPLAVLFRTAPAADVARGFDELLSTRDKAIMKDETLSQGFAVGMKEALRTGTTGGGWDNVAWVGPWEIDPSAITHPVFLWYGDEDRFCAPEHGFWLRDHIANSTFVLRKGEGHLGLLEHTTAMFTALVD